MLNFTKKLIEKYFIDSFFLDFPRFIVILVELITIPIILANLPIKDFGFFSFVLALQLWITTLTAEDITDASKRGIARGLEGTFLFAFFTRLKILLVVGLGVFIVSSLLYFLAPNTLFLLIIIMAIFLIFGYLPQTTYSVFFIAKKEFKEFAIWQTVLPVSTSIAFTLSAFFTHNILICAIVYFSSITFISWFGFLHLVFKNNLFSAYKRNKIDRECVPYGLKLIPASLVQQTSNQITNFIIGPFFGFANLAIFSVAYGLLDKFKGFTKTLNNLFYADFAKSDQDKLIKSVKSKIVQGIFISIILTVVCVLLSFAYIHFFLPESYQQVKIYFLILSLSLPAVILESILATILMANLRHEELTISLILPNLIKIILIFILGILFKIIGICWAVVLGAWISFAFYYLFTMFKPSYNDRRSKAEYIASKYVNLLKGEILDVGCREKDLKRFLNNNIKYTGIDITGNPDILVDLEKQKIPFPDNSFDCVVCTDVLEHLDNIHEVFDDLLRVSRKYVIISLPNCYYSVIKYLVSGKKGLKYYGLPTEKQKNRHKWLFDYEEAEEFISGRAAKNGAKVIEMYPANVKPLRSFIFKIFFGKRYKNLAYPCLWSLIQKYQ